MRELVSAEGTVEIKAHNDCMQFARGSLPFKASRHLESGFSRKEKRD